MIPPVGAEIPYGRYWSTPFARWQGSLANEHAMMLAARAAKEALARWGLAAEEFDYGILGITVPQRGGFYGVPWLMGEIGAAHVGGPTIMQACATSAQCLAVAGGALTAGLAEAALVIAADRTSNGPHIYYPNPRGAGGSGDHEDWVLDNFRRDPFARALGRDLAAINNYGCSLIWGHPQAPTGLRSIIELIEELVMRGGGYGLFAGCAAGDTAMAVVVAVDDL
ncbi:MAG: hypothetical protein FJX56_07515 [Alphaproteobacteria bacterium]|nr:hypothetical protein [Alphaproteobacteria bacterium]